MIKLRQLIPILLLTLCLLAAPAVAAGGAGTAANPYIIQTPAELQSIQNDLSAYYVLGNDIDMSEFNFVPIGSTSAPFFGSLDGKGFTIHNLDIASTGTYKGLFSAITTGVSIKNINFEGCSITNQGSYTGLLYGACIGVSGTNTPIEINNIAIRDSTISATGAVLGGVCGTHTSGAVVTLSNINIISSVISSNQYHVGSISGLLSVNSNITITNCFVDDCFISSTNSYSVGGLIGTGATSSGQGTITENTISNCVIQGKSIAVGGISGVASQVGVMTINDNLIDNCVITGSASIGGVAGVLGYDVSDSCSVYNNSIVYCSIISNGVQAGGVAGRTAGVADDIAGCAVENTTIIATNYAAGICPSFG